MVPSNPGVIVDTGRNLFILSLKSQDVASKLCDNIPSARIEHVLDKYIVNIPIHQDALTILRNMGYNTSHMEPLYWQYDVPLIEGDKTPFDHQVDTAAFLSSHYRGYCTNKMRTGKTGSLAMALDYIQQLEPGAALIISTVSSLRGVWGFTLERTLPHKRTMIVHGTRQAGRLAALRTPADFYVINYDGIKLCEDELKRMVMYKKITTVVIDELTHYGNTTSQRFKALDRIINSKTYPVKRVYGLTGSPGEDPIPIYGMVKMVTPYRLPCKSLTAWRQLTQIKVGAMTWQWKNRKECKDIITKVMQPNIRFNKDALFNLPPVTYQRRDCELTKEQIKHYKELKKDLIAITGSGKVIEAVHKASLIQKLFQISLGVAIDNNGEHTYIDNSSRIKTILEIIAEAEAKVVVFCPYTGVLQDLKQKIAAAGYTVELVDGHVTGTRRDKIFSDFQNHKDPHVVVCHPQTTAFSVDLAAADTMIFNGPPLSGGFVYEQALERLSSVRQKASRIHVVQLSACAEERMFFQGLDSKVKASTLVNQLFEKLSSL